MVVYIQDSDHDFSMFQINSSPVIVPLQVILFTVVSLNPGIEMEPGRKISLKRPPNRDKKSGL